MARITLVLALTAICVTRPSAAQPMHGKTLSPRERALQHVLRPRIGCERSPIRAMLVKRVDYVHWDRTPLSEVLQWLRDQKTAFGAVHVAPRWRQLAGAGIDKRTPISLELENVTVAEVLYEVFDQLSVRDPVTYIGTNRVLKITTRSAMRRRQYTRTYIVADILAQARAARVKPRFAIGRQVGIATVTANAGGLGGAFQIIDVGTILFGGNDNDNEDQDDDPDAIDELADRLVELIQSTIEPDTWSPRGGPGSLYLIDGMLTVRNSADVHEQLGGPFYISPP